MLSCFYSQKDPPDYKWSPICCAETSNPRKDREEVTHRSSIAELGLDWTWMHLFKLKSKSVFHTLRQLLWLMPSQKDSSSTIPAHFCIAMGRKEIANAVCGSDPEVDAESWGVRVGSLGMRCSKWEGAETKCLVSEWFTQREFSSKWQQPRKRDPDGKASPYSVATKI